MLRSVGAARNRFGVSVRTLRRGRPSSESRANRCARGDLNMAKRLSSAAAQTLDIPGVDTREQRDQTAIGPQALGSCRKVSFFNDRRAGTYVGAISTHLAASGTAPLCGGDV